MNALKTLSSFSTLLLIIFYLVLRNKNTDRKFWIIFWYAVLSLTFDVFFRIHELKVYRFYVYSTFTLIEYSSFTYFLYLSYKEKSFKWLVAACLLLFAMIFAYSLAYKSNVDFDYLSSSLGGLLIIIFCILFFYEQMKNPEITFVYTSKSFWIVTGFLIFMSATFFLFMSMGVLTLAAAQVSVLWMLNSVANIIKNMSFIIAIRKKPVMPIDSSL